MPATEWLQNAAGIFPGGVLAFLADAPFGASVSTGLPVGKVLTTSELSSLKERGRVKGGF
jgi:acyl-coenzyme A thioesterase PaaI-like protein